MSESTERSVNVERISKGHYRGRNVRGGTISIGTGEDDDFTPVELLLTALAACTAADVDFITSKRSEPAAFSVTARGNKIRDDGGSRMVDLGLDFAVSFPDDEAGQRAEAVLARSVRQSHDRLCTVTRTVEPGSPVSVAVRGQVQPTAHTPVG